MATATDNEVAQTAKPTYEELEKENKELREENIELTKFVNYVRGLKTHEDFNKLRNVIISVNKKYK